MKVEELAQILGVAVPTVYKQFNQEGDGPFEYNGVVLQRTQKNKNAYDYRIIEEDDDPKRTFESVLETARRHQDKMSEVADHMSDLDVLIDDEMFQMVLDERKQAAKGLRDAIQVLGRMCIEHADRIRFMGIPAEIDDEDEVVDDDDEADLPTFEKVLIYGGDASHHATQKLQKALGASELVWQDDKSKHRKIDSLTQQVENGQFDIVICPLYGVSHNGSNSFAAACKQSDTLFVPVQNGQGVSRILQAVRHHIGQEMSPHGE